MCLHLPCSTVIKKLALCGKHWPEHLQEFNSTSDQDSNSWPIFIKTTLVLESLWESWGRSRKFSVRRKSEVRGRKRRWVLWLVSYYSTARVLFCLETSGRKSSGSRYSQGVCSSHCSLQMKSYPCVECSSEHLLVTGLLVLGIFMGLVGWVYIQKSHHICLCVSTYTNS